MKFAIRRASGKPVSVGTRDSVVCYDHVGNPRTQYLYEIEVDTLGDLVALFTEEDAFVLFESPWEGVDDAGFVRATHPDLMNDTSHGIVLYDYYI